MINDLAKKLLQAIKQVDKTTTGYDTAATVKRIEGDTAWVHIPGGVDETPVKLTINASEGDNVQVRVNGGRAWLQGNATAPPTDDTTANVARTIATDAQEEAVRAGKAADAAEAEAVRAGAAADRAEQSATAASQAAATADAKAVAAGNAASAAASSASAASTAAANAQQSADSALVSLATVEDVAGVLEWITNHGTMTLTSDVTVNPSHVYFVVDAGGDYVVGSTHYSIVSEPKDAELSTYYELSIDKSIQNYVATHIVVDSEGMWLIPDNSNNKILIATGAGTSYTTGGLYIITKINGSDIVLSQFTSSEVVVGQNKVGEIRSVIKNDGMKIMQKFDAVTDIEIAEFGYGQGNNGNGGTSIAPYYTFGGRSGTMPVGNYSVSEGYMTDSTGYCAHTEGSSTTATGKTTHAEGFDTHATGDYSHAEGFGSSASGSNSHAQNFNTIAAYDAQTAIGRYNDNTSANLFEIGNGKIVSGSPQRSNAFTVDNSGNTYAAGDMNLAVGKKYKINGTALAASDVGALPSNTTYVSGVKGDSESSYRSGQVNITAANIGAVPTTRTVNNKALSSDITLTASDVGALSSSTTYVSGVKGNSESTYRTGNVNITPANVGAVALSDKYTRSSAGGLDWTGQTDGDAKVIAKSALAFWSGAYSGNSSNLSKCSTGNIIGSNGGTMTGQLLTSFKSSVAMGSYGTAQTTVDGFVGEVRYSSGCMGSVSINTAYTKNGTTIPTGWYNFIYSPHRSGGNSGAASGDNCNYGTLILSGMTTSAGPFFIQVNGGAVQSVKLISSTGGWTLAGTATGTNTVTISDSNASEVMVKVNPTGTSVYSATILRADLQSIWYVGGYYYSSTDYGIVNINVSNSNKTFQLRNVRNGGSDVKSSSKLTVYYR